MYLPMYLQSHMASELAFRVVGPLQQDAKNDDTLGLAPYNRSRGHYMRMRKKIHPIVLVLLTVAGTFLVFGSGPWQRWLGHRRASLLLIRRQLRGIRTHLIDYKKKHGEFPSSNQGLAMLDNFDAQFHVPCSRGPSASPTSSYVGVYLATVLWQTGQTIVTSYRGYHGRPPRNALELLGTDYYARLRRDRRSVPVTLQVAIGKSDNIYVLTPGGVLSPWYVPYVYENRRGHDAMAFRESPVNCDKNGEYSVRVDEGVYVYSVGGQVLVEELYAKWRLYTWVRVGGAALLVVALAYLIVLVIRSKVTIPSGLAAVILACITGLILVYATAKWYPIRSPFSERRARVASRCKEVLTQYHARGITSDETYAKALESIECKSIFSSAEPPE